MNAFKKINKNGSVTIPKELRSQAGMFPGNGVEVITEENGCITLVPVVPCCHFCGTVENVVEINNSYICQKCASKALSKVDVTDNE